MEQLDGEPASRILRFAKEHDVITTFDVLAVSTPNLTEMVNICLPYVDFFMPNYEEAVMICGLRGLRALKARSNLQERHRRGRLQIDGSEETTLDRHPDLWELANRSV